MIDIKQISKFSFIALLLMIPGHLTIETFGFNGITALPTFFGGMAYMYIVNKFNIAG